MVGAVTLRRVAIILIALQCIGLSQSYAATAKPTPRPAHKVTIIKKAIPKKKVVAKKKAIPKKKVVAKKPVVAKRKVTTKKKLVPKKKVVVHHYIYHKPVFKPVPPSPSPSWPPVGFTSLGFAYARIPTGAELVGILSRVKKPSATINVCAKDPKHPTAMAHSCAAILVAASQKCTWWKITSTVIGIDPANPSKRIALGDITTYAIGAAAKKIQSIFLVSPIPLQTGVKFTHIHALCGIGHATDPVPSTTFVRVQVPVPVPVPVPSASASASAIPIEPAPSTPTATATPTPSP